MKTTFVTLSLLLLLFLPQAIQAQITGTYVAQNGFEITVKQVNGGVLVSGGGETLPYLLMKNGCYMNAARVSTISFSDGGAVIYLNGQTVMLLRSGGIESSSQKNNSQNSTGRVQTQRQSGTCSVCHGSGWSSSYVSAPNYSGSRTTEWCDVCKRRTSPHTHKPCFSCGGLGYK